MSQTRGANYMKDSTVFIICLVTYLLFVLLIITEPIGYDPLWLCIFFFVAFAAIYLIATNTLPRLENIIYKKLPKKIRLIIDFATILAEVYLIFIAGWQINKIWNPGSSIFNNHLILILILLFSIIAVRKGYKKLVRD